MILLSAHDKDEIEIHIKSPFGVNVTVKMNDKTTKVIHNVKTIEWLTFPKTPDVLLLDVKDNPFKFFMSDFYWLSFEPATKIEK